MNIKKLWEVYDYHTETLSTISRQLGLAGLAIVWIFKTEAAGNYEVPAELVWPTIFLVGGLATDFLHYLVASEIWKFYARRKENAGIPQTDEFLVSSKINLPINLLFYTKLVFTIVAYALLLSFLIGKLNAA